MMCPLSEFKDGRHAFVDGRIDGQPTLRTRVCQKCGRIVLQQLTDSGDQPGDVWDVIAECRRLP